MRVYIDKKDYKILSRGGREIVLGRLKIGYVNCPRCRQLFGIYKDEFYKNGCSRKELKHTCGFRSVYCLKDLDKDLPI